MRRPIFFTPCLAGAMSLLLLAQVTRSQVTLSLPFEGHYHPGRYMPVRVTHHSGSPTLRLSGPGALPTTIDALGDGEIIVPFLVVSDSLKSIEVPGIPPIELKPLVNQRLVAVVDSDANMAKALFPTEALIPISLDLNHPLLDPPLAWSGLDAVILSPVARTRLSDEQISTLLAAGVVFMINDSRIPDTRWAWQRVGNLWVLRHNVAGPQDLIRAEAYTPTYPWDRGVPAPTRIQIVLIAAIFSILAVGVSLWRSGRAMIAFLILCALTAAFIFTAYLRRPLELMLEKTIAVSDSRLTQFDDWTWRACLRDARLTQPASNFTVPVFASAHQIEQSETRLTCDSQGRPISYDFRLAPNQSLAFVTRQVLPSSPPKTFAPTNAIWKDFAADLYTNPGDQISGEAPITPDQSATFITRTSSDQNKN